MKKQLTLEQEIEKILRNYWYDPFNKDMYVLTVVKEILAAIERSKKK